MLGSGAVFERAYHLPYLACGALLGGGGVNSGPPVIRRRVCLFSE